MAKKKKSKAKAIAQARPVRRPVIQMKDVHFRDMAQDARDALLNSNQPAVLFVTNGELFEVDPQRGASLVKRVGLFARSAEVADWKLADKRSRPDGDVVRVLLYHPGRGFPELLDVVRTPVFGQSGRLVDEVGYAAADGIYLLDSGLKLPLGVSDTPSQHDVEDALRLLLGELLVDFPFTSQSDRAQGVGALILPAVRPMIKGCTPLHGVEAPTAGSGKGLFTSVVGTIAYGREAAARTLPQNQDEMQKVITAELMRKESMVFLDNASPDHVIDSPHLASVLTTQHWSGRVLGESRMAQLLNRAVWMLTANNPRYSKEIARRVVRIRIDPKQDRPWLRDGFRHPNLLEWVRKNREQLLGAIVTLVQNWIAKGQPDGTNTLGSYEEWSRVIGGILAAAGIDGFLNDVLEVYETSDAEGAEWREFTAAWYQDFGSSVSHSRELFALCQRLDLLGQVLGDGNEKSRQTRLGLGLSSKVDCVFGQLQIVASESGRRRGYRVVPIRGDDTLVHDGDTLDPTCAVVSSTKGTGCDDAVHDGHDDGGSRGENSPSVSAARPPSNVHNVSLDVVSANPSDSSECTRSPQRDSNVRERDKADAEPFEGWGSV